MWKGHIRFSLVTIPIRIYSAVETAEAIRFNQLHKEDNGAVGYDKKCKKCGKVLAAEDIVKGYQFEPDQYVIIAPEDLEKIKLKSTKVIDIEGFIDASEVHPTLYESPYFAGPDGPVGASTYALLTQALQESGKVGVGKVVMRDREEVVAACALGRRTGFVQAAEPPGAAQDERRAPARESRAEEGGVEAIRQPD